MFSQKIKSMQTSCNKLNLHKVKDEMMAVALSELYHIWYVLPEKWIFTNL